MIANFEVPRGWFSASDTVLTPSPTFSHQQNTSLLGGTCDLLEELGSYPSRSKRAPKYHTSSSPSYLGNTCTSKFFLFKLGLLTFFTLFILFWLDFVVDRGVKNSKGSTSEFKKKKSNIKTIQHVWKTWKDMCQITTSAKKSLPRKIKQQACKKSIYFW